MGSLRLLYLSRYRDHKLGITDRIMIMRNSIQVMSVRAFVLWCTVLISMGYCRQEEPLMKRKFPKPGIVPHAKWEKTPPVGFPAEGKRRNIAPGETLEFRGLTVELLEVMPADQAGTRSLDQVLLKLSDTTGEEKRVVDEGAAFNRGGLRIAVLAIHTRKNELGAGLTEFEICSLESVPPHIASSGKAGDAAQRARIAHKITTITLHHSGDPKPMTLEDDPLPKLRALQEWGMKEKNWWDVPYHFLIAPDGTIFEGRDYRYIGETNTKYDPEGHFLIDVMGNFELQEPNDAQLEAIMDLMAWAVAAHDIPLDRIFGHSDFATTACPGKNLKPYLKDGTFVKGIRERLNIP